MYLSSNSTLFSIYNLYKTGGTLYYVSNLINDQSDFKDIEIHVTDGQNIKQIQQYQQLNNTNQWNPCIPITFHDALSVTFKFYANDWKNWYPVNICDFENNKNYYRNEHLFDGGISLTLINLTIADYNIQINRNYPIMRAPNHLKAAINILSASLINISSDIEDALFSSSFVFHVENVTFIGIDAVGVLFNLNYFDIQDPSTYFKGNLFRDISARSILKSTEIYNGVK